MLTSSRQDIALQKITALEKPPITPAARQSLGLPIAEGQSGRMARFAEALPGVEVGVRQFGVSGLDLHPGGVGQLAQDLHTRAAERG
ncbi:hypothetical protein [Accumulibacter sp.]|uniref:hypothetical protein n=1 Tax=Accumulibacter sp. TaxID=2053492 RepID=UPI00260D5C45|nr:hypothetical protein [Accumulibacter sp.]